MATILIVEDDKNLGAMMKEQLAAEGYAVEVVYAGKQGAALALKNPPDLVILDVILPDITGFQLCNQLRLAAETRTVPIIMMSAAAKNPNQRAFGLERGANEYVIKPFEMSALIAMVQRYIGHKQPKPGKQPKTNPGTPSESSISKLRFIVDQALKNYKKTD